MTIAGDFYGDITLHNNELKEVNFERLPVHPSPASIGRIYYNTTSNNFYGYNGSEWLVLEALPEIIRTKLEDVSKFVDIATSASEPGTLVRRNEYGSFEGDFYDGIDMHGSELKNVVAEKLASPPTSPLKGQFYFNTTSSGFYVYTGTVWSRLDFTEEQALAEFYTKGQIDELTSILQNQIDGNIQTWFYEVEPTLTNEPYILWTTTKLKNQHLGDLYYDTVAGYCYRFSLSNDVYSWVVVADTDITKALNAAATAQTTANSKKRVFSTTPTPPYDIGDLWTQGSSGDLMRCKTSVAIGGTYSAAHWERAFKWDMARSVYDTNANGIVDNAEKVNGLSVQTAVPSGAVFTDTVTTVNGKTGTIAKADIVALGIPGESYTHPSTHPALMITQDSTHRFVTDEEKDIWNQTTMSSIVEGVLSTTWAGTETPYTQTFTHDEIVANSIIDFNLSSTATNSEIQQWNQLNLTDGGQTEGSFTIKCNGTKNTTALPIIYTIMSPMIEIINEVSAVGIQQDISSLETNISGIDDRLIIAEATITENSENITSLIASGLTHGDMKKAIYDTTANGVVDNSEKVNNLTVETAVPLNAIFTDTIYIHPESHPASIITQNETNRFVTDAEKTTWNAKQTALGYTPEDVANKGVVNGYASLDAEGKVPSAQLPTIPEGHVHANKAIIDKIIAGIEASYDLDTFVTDAELVALGAGDMLKATYDTTNNGIVDNAEKVNGFTVEKSVPSTAVFTDTVYTHPTYAANTSGLYKITTNTMGHVSGTTAVVKADITALGIPAQDTTYGLATTSANGLMSSSDKTSLSTVATNSHTHSNKTILDKITTGTAGSYNLDSFVTSANFTSLGAGDMLKSTYDTTNNGIVDNAEKVSGFTVAKSVPSNAVFTDTVYTHPSTHPPSIIAQDASNRFVTDSEKSTWNSFNPTSAISNHASDTSLHKNATSCSQNTYGANAEGTQTTASGQHSHAEGYGTTSSGNFSHAEGYGTYSGGTYSHSRGYSTYAYAEASTSEGMGTTADIVASHALGKYNKSMVTSDIFVIGNGFDANNRSNCFRVTDYGQVMGIGGAFTAGADYAEYFEWLDENPNGEDRVGYFVTLEGEKIKKASSSDYILGIISATPSVVGDSYSDDWNGRYLKDEWGRSLREDVLVPATYHTIHHDDVVDEDGVIVAEAYDEQIVLISERVENRFVQNPDWNNEETYIPRQDRPEWDAVGMIGKLFVRDDGTCIVNSYCKSNDNGIATASELGYRVMKRVNENIIQVLLK